MKKIYIRNSFLILLLHTCLTANSQYLVRLTFYDYSDKVGYATSVVFFKNSLNDINVNNLLRKCQDVDSLFLNFGIPLIDPGYIPDNYGYTCKKVDSLHFTLDNIFKSDSCFSIKDKSNLCSVSLDFLKIDGEFCIIRQLFPYFSHAPKFGYVGTIISITRIYALNKMERKGLEITLQE